MHIMVIPSWYSSDRNKVHGSFFKEQFIAQQKYGEKITVAYNEIWPLNLFTKIKEKSGLVNNNEDGLNTYRYKQYNYLPKNPLMFKIFNRRMDKLYKEIVKREGKVDIIHAHSALWGGISAAYIAKKYDIPLIITEHSSLKYSKYLRDSYRKYVYNAYDSANEIIAVGTGLKEELKKYTNTNISVIPNLVDLSIFKSDNIKKSDLGKTKILFSLSYLVPEKGMDLLISAFNKSLKGEDVKLIIGGEGSEKGKLEAEVKRLGLEKQIFFIGALSREQVVEQMKKCDGFVLTSEHETFGVVYIEAMAMGKPILGTKNGGAEDIIKDYNGILANNRDINSIAECLKEFIYKLPFYDNKIIQEKCIEYYNQEIIVRRINEVYLKIINKNNSKER